METRLTKQIKLALRYYNPAMNSKLRTVRWAEEVDVGSGYVDSIRFEDYIVKEDKIFICNKDNITINNIKEPPCKQKKTCVGCIYKSSECNNREIGILTTCYEIKITKSDFKTKHGHNFVGNHNYYVIPKELYPEVKELVPNNIGVILYYSENGSLRIKKKCKFKEIEDSVLSRLLYNAMKKWVDNSTKYWYDNVSKVEVPRELLITTLDYLEYVDKDKLKERDKREFKTTKNKINYYIKK